MYSVIMVPVDGSVFSREAVFQGLRLARRSNAQLRLVRVATMPAIMGRGDRVSADAWFSERDAMLAQLYQLAAECRENALIDVTATVEDGPVADALRGHALRHAVDLIVMATHARTGMSRVWHGSVADRLIRESGIPVLVVRPPSLATALIDGSCYRRIIVPLDGSALAEQSIEPALDVAEIEHAELTLLRVVPSADDIRVGEIQSSIGAARARDVDEAEHYLSKIRVRVAHRASRVRTAVVVADDVSGAIRGFAQQNDGDLIAIATRGRSGIARAVLGSVADRVMSEGMLSALVIHPTEKIQPAVVADALSTGAVVLG